MKLRKIIKTRHSGMEDTFWVVAVLFAMAIFFIVLNFTWGKISPKLETGLEGAMPADGINITTTLDQTTNSTTIYNTLFPLIIIGLFAFTLISAFFMNSHPIFFFVGILLLGVALIFGAIFSNVYHRIAENDQLASSTDNFPIMDLFMKNLPLFVLIIFVVVGLILWSKFGGGGSGGGL